MTDAPSPAISAANAIGAACGYERTDDGIWESDGGVRRVVARPPEHRLIWWLDAIWVSLTFTDDGLIADVTPYDGDSHCVCPLPLTDELSLYHADDVSEGMVGQALGRGNDAAQWIACAYRFAASPDPSNPESTRHRAIDRTPSSSS